MRDSDEFVDRCITECSTTTGSTNSNSLFHKIFVTVLAFNFGVPCLFVYGFGFFELMPQLKCNHELYGISIEQCVRERVCNKEILNYTIDYSHEFTIDNWVTDYNLLCVTNSEIGLFGSLLLAGFFFGSVFFVRLGDHLGRLPVILGSTLISTVALICCLILSPTLPYLLLNIFIFGLTIAPRLIMSYVLAIELTPKEHHSYYSSLPMIFDSLGMIFLGVYFQQVRSMNPMIVGMIVANLILIALIWHYIPESPKFLYEKG